MLMGRLGLSDYVSEGAAHRVGLKGLIHLNTSNECFFKIFRNHCVFCCKFSQPPATVRAKPINEEHQEVSWFVWEERVRVGEISAHRAELSSR